jgi:hypothetical protein
MELLAACWHQSSDRSKPGPAVASICNCNCNCCHRHTDTSHDRQVPSPGGSDTQHDPRTTYRHTHTTSHVATLPEPSRDHATTHKPLSLPNEHTSYQRPTSSPIQLQLPSQINMLRRLLPYTNPHPTTNPRQSATPPAPHQQLPPDMWPQPRPRPQRSPRTRISTLPTSVLYRDRHQPLLAAHTTPILPSPYTLPEASISTHVHKHATRTRHAHARVHVKREYTNTDSLVVLVVLREQRMSERTYEVVRQAAAARAALAIEEPRRRASHTGHTHL